MPQSQYDLLKKGDPAALEQIYVLYSRSISWLGKRMLDDHFVVESLVQNTFLKLWMHRDRIESPRHIFFFLRFVMKRECISYYGKPKTRFLRKVHSLEDYDHYQDYMAGYDPVHDSEHLKVQDSQQEAFNRVRSVLPLLSTERRHLIELCLKYGFQYKAISQAMGTSMNETFHEVKRAIENNRTILNRGSALESRLSPPTDEGKVQDTMTEKQATILKLRFRDKYSFALIADTLDLSQKEVHREFIAAHRFMQEQPQPQMF